MPGVMTAGRAVARARQRSAQASETATASRPGRQAARAASMAAPASLMVIMLYLKAVHLGSLSGPIGTTQRSIRLGLNH
jgi:hypothetical protein